MILVEKNWARSLHDPKSNNQNKEMCGWSDDLQVVIHRFDMNATICRCGKMEYHKQEYKGGWRRQKFDESE